MSEQLTGKTGQFSVEGEVTATFRLSPETFEEWKQGLERNLGELIRDILVAGGYDPGIVKIHVEPIEPQGIAVIDPLSAAGQKKSSE